MDHYRTYIQHIIGQFFRAYKTHIPPPRCAPLGNIMLFQATPLKKCRGLLCTRVPVTLCHHRYDRLVRLQQYEYVLLCDPLPAAKPVCDVWRQVQSVTLIFHLYGYKCIQFAINRINRKYSVCVRGVYDEYMSRCQDVRHVRCIIYQVKSKYLYWIVNCSN